MRQVILSDFIKQSLLCIKPLRNDTIFWVLIIIGTIFRLFITSDINVQMAYGPHDGSLYLERAFNYIQGKGFGLYNSQMLIKLPGISFWMAWMKWLNIPFMLSINIMYSLAGVYFVSALKRTGFSRLILITVYVVYLLNPFSYQHFFLNVFREPIDTAFFVIILSALVFIFDGIRKEFSNLLHLIIYSVALSFMLLLREENTLLYSLLFGVVIVALFLRRERSSLLSESYKWRGLQLLVIPLSFIILGNLLTKSFVKKHYGVSIINDFGSGEFPKFIAALRSVKSSDKSRHVSIPQNALSKINQEVPELRNLIAHLPPTPGVGSVYHQRYGVVNEWPNSHFFFWIKDTAFATQDVKTLSASQDFFKMASKQIEAACDSGRLDCKYDGGGLFPRPKISWVGPFIDGVRDGLFLMVHMSANGFRAHVPHIVYGLENASVSANISLGRKYEHTTKSQFDSLLQHEKLEARSNGVTIPLSKEHQDLIDNLDYWFRYPDVASNNGVGIKQHILPKELQKIYRELQGVISTNKLNWKKLLDFGLVDNNSASRWKNYPMDNYFIIQYLTRNLVVASELKKFPHLSGGLGASHHFATYGRSEGRTWGELSSSKFQPSSAFAFNELRGFLSTMIVVNKVLLALGLVILIVRLIRIWKNKGTISAFELTIGLFFVYLVLKILALAYLSVPMGNLDHRLYFSTYCVLVLFSAVSVGEACRYLVCNYLMPFEYY